MRVCGAVSASRRDMMLTCHTLGDMARCIYCGSNRTLGEGKGRLRCASCGQEQPTTERRNLQARQALEDKIRASVGDDHDYEPSGYGPCKVCRWAEWLHHPGFSRRQE
jgi:hypothetical protein